MAPQRYIGLPPISHELKPITPYLQRADELKSQEPIVAYWCAYYAAQVGISLKARDPASREVLLALLSTLERMKEEIGPSDAIDMEAASSAYVENFALKVFSMADNEDRSGNATRSTAKKFLAAANFLEILKTFPKSEVAESNEDKIRYAKWKAADIAKAYRENRKPVPGPAGSELEQNDLVSTPPKPNNEPITALTGNFSQEAGGSPEMNASSSPPQIFHPSHPHPRIEPADISRLDEVATPPRRRNVEADLDTSHLAIGSGWAGEGEATPGSWSTTATPGDTQGNTPAIGTPSPAGHDQASYDWDKISPTGRQYRDGDRKPRSGSGSSSGSGESGGILHRPGSRNGATLEGKSTSPPKNVSFSSPSIDQSAPENLTPSATFQNPLNISAAFSQPTSTPTNYPAYNVQPIPQASHTYITPSFNTPVPPPTISASQPPPAVELTPTIIAKAQRHCRFAISSLDYEDGDQARKELRAALAILGG